MTSHRASAASSHLHDHAFRLPLRRTNAAKESASTLPRLARCQEIDIRKKAKANQAHNETPHLLSCGGYKMLAQNMLEEKIKAHSTSIKEGNSVDSLRPP
ncbi:hypothetical protein VNO80_06471 [Phaseolus coccineus]|uniref:Uncharacterized protein n=1 Tax=Phaseolus coccineus TaxID=3886 RepID=A0AAN9NIF0_PHACN